MSEHNILYLTDLLEFVKLNYATSISGQVNVYINRIHYLLFSEKLFIFKLELNCSRNKILMFHTA